jgi:hypothetical protein
LDLQVFFIADFESPDRFLLAGWGVGWRGF